MITKKLVATMMAVLSLAFSTFFFIEERYAHASEVKKNTSLIHNIKTSMVYQKALDNYYNIKSLVQKYPNDQDLKDQLARAKEEVEFLKKKLEKQDE